MGFFKSIGKAIAKTVKKISKPVFDIVAAPVKWTGKALTWVGKKVGGDVGKILGGAGAIGTGIVDYADKALGSIIDGVFTGHIRQALTTTLDLVASAAIIIAGVFTYNPYLIAAGVAYADYRFGNGNLIVRPAVNVTTGFLADTGILKHAREYREEIALIVGVSAGILASYGVGAFVSSLGISQSIITTYNAINSVNMFYNGYVSYKNYEELKEQLREQLEEYKKYLQSLEEEKKQANDLFLNQALNFNLYEWFAGGKKYNEFSIGNAEYDYMNTKNPWFVALNESEEKAKNYEDLKPYLSYKSLNVYDDFFEKTLKVDSVFGIASIKQFSNKDMYINVANEYNHLVDLYNAKQDLSAKFGTTNLTVFTRIGKILASVTFPVSEEQLKLKEKELKYYERYLQ
ncbi:MULTISPECIES: hypothetical protein [unclassified Campylobacter]|uniref:hypothetical protein n=1 Tax=unclassified Campylobacter TaxID=2593542 RepID=UPI001EFB2634|nr:hypothetical protein [Campylobacter sp. RM12651]MBZ7976710.1 hypothetical protein [Campylobacter sp. RM12637]ULO02921.1 putative membrane protein [Campylobacter sp. RM12651]